MDSSSRQFQAALLNWYDANKRDLPWRRTSDPYAILVSEFMLQQTQVATVLPYYARWMERFSTVASLAGADEQEVLMLWAGLGYYSRCRNLHKAAKALHTAGIPTNSEGWMKLPGIGPYTAAAVASIAQSEAAAVMDGNVRRVYARLVASDDSGEQLNREAWRWARSTLSLERPGDWNQAVMELGATVCTPKNPKCAACPCKNWCRAYQLDRSTSYPVAKEKLPPTQLTWTCVVPRFEELYGVERIPAGQWWHGMWQFPIDKRCEIGANKVGIVKHTVTRYKISMEIHVDSRHTKSQDLTWKTRAELDEIPMPSIQKKVLALIDKFQEARDS